jgi:MFS family permease
MHEPLTASRAHKTTLLVALYVAQGLPYGFFTSAMPVLLREEGYSLKAISLLSLLSWPWALKFLWAPYLDHVGTRKAWLLSLQLAAVAAALLLTQLNLDQGMVVVLSAALVFNFIAASQDVVTDGLAVRVLTARERGLANGIQVGAYRIGMILGGAVLLWLLARTDWTTAFLYMAVLLMLTVVPVLWLREPTHASDYARPGTRSLAVGWARRLLMPGMLGFIALLFGYRFGDAMISSLIGPFLKDNGLATETIALMRGAGSTTSLIGAFIGGWFAFTAGRRTALLASGLAQAACFVLYIVAAMSPGNVPLLWTATVLEGVIGTMATVALFTLMMDASDPDHAGTDYTLLASCVVLVQSLGAFAGGFVADMIGYAATFIIGTLAAVTGCLVLIRSLDRRPTPARVAQVWRR